MKMIESRSKYLNFRAKHPKEASTGEILSLYTLSAQAYELAKFKGMLRGRERKIPVPLIVK